MRNVVAVSFPKHVWTLLAVYFVASLAHFAHNAEFIAYYPNMPAWLTRDDIYLAWSAVTSAGVAGPLRPLRSQRPPRRHVRCPWIGWSGSLHSCSMFRAHTCNQCHDLV